MDEPRPRSRFARRLEREAALPLPRTGIAFLIAAGFLLLVLANADGLLWKYSDEREQLRTQAVLAERQHAAIADELRELRRENEALRQLHRDSVAPQPYGGVGERGALPPPCQR
jgi:hypothetical protein